jgi:hypothetical protein
MKAGLYQLWISLKENNEIKLSWEEFYKQQLDKKFKRKTKCLRKKIKKQKTIQNY